MIGRLLAIAALVACTGCGLQHSNVKGLSEAQDSYFADLGAVLKQDRELFKTGLEEQMKANQERRRQLLSWERDLAKTEVLIRAGKSVGGRRSLLLMKTAELDLASLDRLRSLDDIDRARLEAILKLYDEVQQAAAALQRNNAAITAYLSASDRQFVLRSLDIEGLIRITSAIRQVEEEIKQIDDEAVVQRREEEARVQKALQRARDVLVNGFEMDTIIDAVTDDGGGDDG